MKEQLQVILKVIDNEYDKFGLESKLKPDATTKEIFMSGVFSALAIVNGLDFFTEDKRE